jgi:hypothetical protein
MKPREPYAHNTEEVLLTLRVKANRGLLEACQTEIDGLPSFFEGVFIQRQPLGIWDGSFEIVEVLTAEEVNE